MFRQRPLRLIRRGPRQAEDVAVRRAESLRCSGDSMRGADDGPSPSRDVRFGREGFEGRSRALTPAPVIIHIGRFMSGRMPGDERGQRVAIAVQPPPIRRSSTAQCGAPRIITGSRSRLDSGVRGRGAVVQRRQSPRFAHERSRGCGIEGAIRGVILTATVRSTALRAV